MLQITPLIRERIKLLRDVLTAADFFFVDQLPPYDPAELVPQKGDAAMAKKALQKAQTVLPDVEFKHDPLDQALRAAAQELGLKAGQMFQPIRVAVCGRKKRAPVVRNPGGSGKKTTLLRIDQALKKRTSNGLRYRRQPVLLQGYCRIPHHESTPLVNLLDTDISCNAEALTADL